MSRTAIGKHRIARLTAVIALLAVCFGLLVQDTFAQDLRPIGPDDVVINSYNDGVYIRSNEVYRPIDFLTGYQLRLGSSVGQGRIRVEGGILQFNQRLAERLLEIQDGVPEGTYAGTLTETNDGGAVFIDGEPNHRYQFSASSNSRAFMFGSNRTLGSGGAIYVRYAVLDLVNIYFDDNIADGSAGANMERGGGALFNRYGRINFYQVYFTRNNSMRSGGAIYNLGGSEGNGGVLVFTARATFTSGLPVNHDPTWNTPTWGYTQGSINDGRTQGNGTASPMISNVWADRTGGLNNNTINHAVDHPTGAQNIGRFVSDPVFGNVDPNNTSQLNGRLNVTYLPGATAIATDGTHVPIPDGINVFVNNYTTHTFVKNTAGEDGAALYNNTGTIQFPTDATSGSATVWSRPQASNGTSVVPDVGVGRRTQTKAAIFYDNSSALSGGALYSLNGTLLFSNTATVGSGASVDARATATAGSTNTALAHRGPSGTTLTTPVYADTGAISYLGIFLDNKAGLHGGAIYYTGAFSLDFLTTAGAATANAVPSDGYTYATAQTPGDGQTSVATALADGWGTAAAGEFTQRGPNIARAGTVAGIGYFGHNIAGNNSANTRGDGGALYVDHAGTLNFGANALAATANAGASDPVAFNVTATANQNGSGQAHARASASDRADAGTNVKTGYFEDNRTLTGVGGAIFITNGGTINFSADVAAANAVANASARTQGNGTTRVARHTAEANAFTSAEAGFFTENIAVGIVIPSGGGLPERIQGGDGGAIHSISGNLTFDAGNVEARATSNANSQNAAATGTILYPTIIVPAPGGVTGGGGADARSQATSFARTGEFHRNRALQGFGGAIYTEEGTLSFTAGDAIAIAYGSANVATSGFSNARAYAHAESVASNFVENYALSGGALYSEGGTIRFEAAGSVTSRSDALGNAWAGQPAIDGSFVPLPINTIYSEARSYAALFTGNRATGDGTMQTNVGLKERITGYGGAIFNKDGDLRFITAQPVSATAAIAGNVYNPANPIYETTFADRNRGGPSRYPQSFADVAAAIFTENEANIHGGAIYTDSGSLLFTGTSRFLRNKAGVLAGESGYGGALYNDNAVITLIAATVSQQDGLIPAGFSTFTENTAELGGAIYNDGVLDIYNASTATEGVGRIAGREEWAPYYSNTTNPFDELWGARFGGFYSDLISPSNNRELGNDAIFGGALYNTAQGSMLLTHVYMDYNTARSGGAIYNDQGELTIFGGLFTLNKAEEFGGVLYNLHGTDNLLVIDGTGFGATTGGVYRPGTLFDMNEAGIAGGVVYIGHGTEGHIGDARFSGNKAGDEGGALWNAGSLFLTDVTFRANNTLGIPSTGRGGRGGAVYNDAFGTMSFTNARFEENQTSEGGLITSGGEGGAVYNAGLLTFTNSAFTQNRAYDGGALYNLGGEITITDANFENNSAERYGGAIYSQDGTVTFNVTDGTSVFNRNRGANLIDNANPSDNAESIYFGGHQNTFNVDIAEGSRLTMYDPMRGSSGTNITQTGTGLWQLSGINNFTAGAAHFDIQEGTLHLYQHNYRDHLVPDIVHAELRLGDGSFRLRSDAVLEVDGAVFNLLAPVPSTSLIASNTSIHSNSSLGTFIHMEAGSVLVFNLSEADIRRSSPFYDYQGNRLTSGNPVNSTAALTTSAQSITIASTVSVYLTGDPITNLDATSFMGTWFDWFAVAGNELYLFNNASQRYNYLTSGGVYDNGTPYMAQRRADGSIDAFVVEYGWLKLQTDATPWTLYWTGTGSPSDVWNETAQNWIGVAPAGVSSTTYNFFSGDHVVFADQYTYTEHGLPVGPNPRNVTNKTVNLGGNVTVGSLNVTGTNYVLNIEPGVTLRSERTLDALGNVASLGHMNFGSAQVNLGDDAEITAVHGRVNFGTGSVLNVGTGYSGINATAPTAEINFAPGSIIHFDMAGARVGDPVKLTLTSPLIQLLGSFRIQQMPGELVSAVTLNVGERITLLQGVGTTDYTNPIVVLDRENNPYVIRRSAAGVVYEFQRNGNNLELYGSTTAEGWNLYWTGDQSTVWDAVATNWLGHYIAPGVLDPEQYTRQFGMGDFVTFADTYVDTEGQTQTAVRRNITLGEIDGNEFKVFGMEVIGSDYQFTLPTGIKLSAEYDIGFGTARVNMAADTAIYADRNIFFSEGAEINVFGAGATISAGTQIGFVGDNDFYFDFSANIFGNPPGDPGVQAGDTLLTILGNVNMINSETGALGGGTIFVRDDRSPSFDFIDPVTGMGHVVLIKIEGKGTVTDKGTLMVWDSAVNDYVANTPQRSKDPNADSIIGLGFGLDDEGNTLDNELWLLAADAGANADIFWLGVEQTGSRTGEDNSTWNTEITNWTGRTDAGINVMTFLAGDRVFFTDLADNRRVNLSIPAEVASMTVTATGYTFDLTGSTVGIHAERGIDFGNETTIISDTGTVVHSDTGTINFGTDAVFTFHVSYATREETVLSLQGAVTVNEEEKIGSGDINVLGIFDPVYYNTLFRAGDVVELVNAGYNTGITAKTGDLNIQHYTQRRSSVQGQGLLIGLDTDKNESQLFLRFIDAGTNSTDLHWTGSVDRVWDVNTTPNWRGTVANIIQVDTFLNGDTVFFADDVSLSRRRVDIAEGGVRVNSMYVTGSNYTFDIREGGITAANRVELNDATLFLGIEYDGEWMPRVTTGFNQITADSIKVDNTRLVLDFLNIDPDLINGNGHMDFVILESKEAHIEGNVNPYVYIETNPFYTGEFYVDNTASPNSGYGVLRVSKFLFEGWNYNTMQAASAMNALRDAWAEDDVEIFSALAANPHTAVNQLRGTEIVANSAMIAMWRPWELTHQRLRTIRNESGWNSWGGAYYRFGDIESDKNARGYNLHRPGTMVGADYGTNQHWQFGAVFGYAIPTIRNSNGKIDAGDLTVGLYSKYNFFDMGTISTFLGYGYQAYKMHRYDYDGGDIWGDFSGDAAYGSIEYVRVVDLGGVGAAMPLVAIDHQTSWTKSFTETGYWGQTVAATNMGRTMVRVGLDSKWDMDMFGSFDISTRLHAAYLISGPTRSSVETYFPVTSAKMNLRGTDMGKGQINVGVTASGEYRMRYNWFLDVDGYLTETMYALQGGIGISTRW